MFATRTKEFEKLFFYSPSPLPYSRQTARLASLLAVTFLFFPSLSFSPSQVRSNLEETVPSAQSSFLSLFSHSVG